MEFGTIREPIVEGIFYPDEPDVLENRVRDLLQRSETPAGLASAIIAPHAGYDYCGTVLADAFKACAARDIRRVVIIGPVHRDPEDAVFLPESGWFRTPLGLIPVHTESIRALERCSPRLIRNDIPHLEEHCIEIHLPFIQYLFPRAAIVPILVGTASAQNTLTLASAMTEVFGAFGRKDILIVLSVNLTNYLDSTISQREAGRLIDMILSSEGDRIRLAHERGELTTCGAGTLAAFFAYADDVGHVELLGRGASSTTNRDRSNTVEYASIGVY
jgi:hypothetical protein